MANSMTVSAAKTANAQLIAETTEEAKEFKDKIEELVSEQYVFPVLNLVTNPVDTANIVGRVDTIPVPNDYAFGAFTKAAPEAPTFDTIAVPDFGPIPELIISAPVVNMPVAPNTNLPGAPGAAPTLNVVALPDAPVVTLPDVPSFQNVSIPAVPSYSIPTYNAVFPDDDLLAPSFTFTFDEQAYQSDMLDALKAELMDNLLNGGYGINTADEQLLWERAREREMLAAETTIQQATADAASRGFPMPPGALLAVIEGAQQAALEKISSVNRDIALKRADMYVENRKFTIQQVRETEQMLITYFGYMMERALNAAKYTSEMGKHIYDALVARYQARVAGAQAASQAYEVQLKAGLAALEAYKVEMEGARLAVDVQKLVADVYNAQLDGVKTFVDVYRTQMEASKVASEIERLKLEAFRISVDTYSAQVAAKSAEFGMYKAQIEGEMSKVEIYKAQVGAYAEQVQAYSSGASAKRVVLDAQIEAARLELETFNGQIKTYTTALEADKIYLDSLLGKHNADTQRYSARVQAQAAIAASTASATKSNADMVLAKAKVAGDYATATAAQLTSQSTLTGNLAFGMYKNYQAVITGAVNQTAFVGAEIQQ
jgi:hypothetical protein